MLVQGQVLLYYVDTKQLTGFSVSCITHSMSTQPMTEHEHIVHALNIHGTFFERWCQYAISQIPEWHIQQVNYPVEFPPRNGPFLGEASALDIWAELSKQDTILTLPIECKKHNPELANWIFFRHRHEQQFQNGGTPSVTIIENIPRQAPNTGWDIRIGKQNWSAISYTCADEARETRSSYLDYKRAAKNLNQLTKTTKNSIDEACQQIALATQALVNDEYAYNNARRNKENASLPFKTQLFLPTIVTTAKLFFCSFDAADVDVVTGEIPYDKVTIKEHPYLLYEYPLPRFLQHSPQDLASVRASSAWNSFIRMDILVINSNALIDILSKIRSIL